VPQQPRLVHRSEHGELWHGDSLEVLDQIAKETVGLLLADPPYGVQFVSNFADHGPIANDRPEDRAVVRAVMAKAGSKVGQKRHVYCFGPRDALADMKLSAVVEMVWDKGVSGMGDLALPYGASHELVHFAVSMYRHGGKVGAPTLPARLRQGTVLRCTRKTGRNNRRHPTEKPVELLRDFVESSTFRGEVVLDPFAGAGSTGVAAVLEGRRYFLIEQDAVYANTAAERLVRAEAAMERLGHDL
jgi:site-specific DNA-methyltransferase (adenine-specific)